MGKRHTTKVVLMAGGKGERFWPRSRADFPKQFLDLDGTGSLIRTTFNRIVNLVSPDSIYVATLAQYRDLTLRELPELPEDHLILEPVGRDTAPSLGLAAVWLQLEDPDAIMVALPADHLITNEAMFLATLEAAIAAAASGPHLVTLGVNPTRPETGYGYIQLGELHDQFRGLPVHKALRFVEKPTREVAERYMEAGDYLWNAGMFVWQVGVFLEEIRLRMPELYEVLQSLSVLGDRQIVAQALPDVFYRAPRLSIDFGVMEHSDKVLVLPAHFGWDDLGSWATVERVRPRDRDGNIIRGNALLYDAKGVIVEGISRRQVAVVGVRDLIVVDTDDAVLVCALDHAQDVKKVASQAEQGSAALEHGQPPGGMTESVREVLLGSTTRVLEVSAGHTVCLDGMGEGTFYLQAGEGSLSSSQGTTEASAGQVITLSAGLDYSFTAGTNAVLVLVTPSPRGSVSRRN